MTGAGGAAAGGSAAGEPEVVVVRTAEAAAVEAARRITGALAGAVAARGRADWATTGGSTPGAIYRALGAGAVRGSVPWHRVQLWWGDDRFVPRDHPLSNVRIADQLLLDPHLGVPIPATNVHPFPIAEAIGEARGAAWCAARYIGEIRTSGVAVEGGWPVFDVVLLGIGPDGHLLSVFPRSAAFESTDWALAVPAPTHIEPHVERVTLNPRILDAARLVLAVVIGEGKAEMLGTLFGAERDERRWPAQLARRPGAAWIVDEAAAARLPADLRASSRAGARARS